MIKSILKTAWRNIAKHKFYSVVNIFGLSLALSFALLISSYIWGELRVNENLRNIDEQYLVQSKWRNPEMGAEITTLGAVGSTLKQEFPDLVKDFYRFDGINVVVSKGAKHFQESAQAGDSSLLSMFGFRLLYGNAKTALNAPNSMVITASKAFKYFGKLDVIGSILTVQNFSGGRQDYQVTGVLPDLPLNSVNGMLEKVSEIFIPMNSVAGRSMGLDWTDPYIVTFIELQPGVTRRDLEKPLQQMLALHTDAKTKSELRLYLTSLKDLYLDNPTKKWLITLSLISGFILLMAGINFVNISIGSSESRLREIGIRKVLGSLRKQLVFQFLTESTLLVSLAMGLSLIFYIVLNPVFSDLLGKELTSISQFPKGFILIPILGVLVVGILSGGYPAMVLSSFRSVDSLKGRLNSLRGGVVIRQFFTTLQFVVAIIVSVSALAISSQVNFFFNKDLGYNKSSLLTISSLPRQYTPEGVSRLLTIADQLSTIPGIQDVSLSYEIPDGRNGNSASIVPSNGDSSQAISAKMLMTDDCYAKTYQLQLIGGQFFNEAHGNYNEENVVINASAAKSLGWKDPTRALGQKVRLLGNPFMYTIAGITRDFNFGRLNEAISPIIFINIKSTNAYRYFSIRLKPGNIGSMISVLQKRWSKLLPGQPFDFIFMDDRLQELYKTEIQLKKAAYVATFFSLIVVFLGVVGVVSQSSTRRTREIGIRKVLGGTTLELILLFFKEFTPAFIFANLIAWPTAFFLLHRWLQDYSYRMTLNLVPFIIATTILILTTGAIIFTQTFKAARRNPMHNLKVE